MSRNNRNQSARPYDVSKAFVKRVADKVSSYIPSSLKSFLGNAFENEQQPPQQQLPQQESNIPAQKRPRIEIQSTSTETNHISISTIRSELGPSIFAQHQLDTPLMSRPNAGTIFAGIRGGGPISSSTPIVSTNLRPLLGQPLTRTIDDQEAGPSGLQNQSNYTEVNGENLSDSSESTSGCSSLAPGNLGGASERDLQKSTSLNIRSPQKSFNSTSGPVNQSIFSQRGRRQQQGEPQPPASSKRPAFDISLLSPQRRKTPTNSSEKPTSWTSPFYYGRTRFGGASAKKNVPLTPDLNMSMESVNNGSERSTRLLNLDNSLTIISQNRVPRRLRGSPAGSISSLSSTEPRTATSVAKRILEAMESVSSPISECSRIPLDDSSIKRKRPASDEIYDYLSPQSKKQQGPPTNTLAVPGVQDLLRLKRQQAKLVTNEAASKVGQPQKRPSWDEVRTSYSLRTDDSSSAKHTNKIVRKLGKEARSASDKNEIMPDIIELPQVTLSITNLPKFDIPVAPPPVATAASSVNSMFGGVTKQNPSFTSTAPKFSVDSPFTFSSPKMVKNKIKNHNHVRKSADKSIEMSFSWPNKTIETSIPSENKQSVEKKKVTFNEQPPIKELFKVDPGTWACEVCDIRNKNDINTCIACTSPKPGSKPTTNKVLLATSPPQPSLPLLPLSASLGNKFSNAGKWECSVCMLWNVETVDKCPSCTTPRETKSIAPAAPIPTIAVTSGFGDKFKKSSETWECQECLVVNKNDANSCVACTSSKPGTTAENKSTASSSLFKFGTNSASTASTAAPQFKFGVDKADAPETSSQFKFGVTSSADKPLTTTSTAPAFSFGGDKSVGIAPFSFGVPKADEQKTFPPTSTSQTTSVTNLKEIKFGSPASKPEVTFPNVDESQTEERPAKRKLAEETPPSFLLGNAAKPTGSFAFSTTSAATTAQTSTPGLFTFGASAAASNTTTGAGFSTPSFGAAKPADTPLFGVVKPAETPLFGAAKPADKPLFGAAKPADKPLFGVAAKPADPTPFGTAKSIENPLFSSGKPEEKTSFGSPKTTVMTFGASKGEAPAFGSQVAVSKPNELFKFGATETKKPADNLFGNSHNAPMFGARSSSPFGVTKPDENKPAFPGVKPLESTPAFGTAAISSEPKPFTFGDKPAAATAFSAPVPSFGSSFGGNTVEKKDATPAFGSKEPAKPDGSFASIYFGTSTTTSAPAPFTATTSNQLPFGATTTTPAFGSLNATNTPFGASPSTKSSGGFGTTSVTPAFGSTNNPPPAFGSAAASNQPAFGSTNNNAPAFGAPNNNPPAFGTNPTPAFGAPSGGTSTAVAPFTFNAKPANPPPAYPFGSSQNQSSAPGGFAFGSNTGAPVNSNQFNVNANTEKPFAFGANAPSAFPAIKPAEQQQQQSGVFQFGQSAPPNTGFGSSAAPQFGAGTNTAGFPTPNFGFGTTITPMANAFGANPVQGQNPSGGFMFGQNQQAPTFNPNMKPTFNFTAGAAPTAFQATVAPPDTSAIQQQRKIRRATRRIPPR